jgi:hypothetical protein
MSRRLRTADRTMLSKALIFYRSRNWGERFPDDLIAELR